MLTMFIFLVQLYCALLVKWYNEAMVRLNCKFDSYLGHHIYDYIFIDVSNKIIEVIL